MCQSHTFNPRPCAFVSNVCFCFVCLQNTEPGGHFICTVYVEESDTKEQHVKVRGTQRGTHTEWVSWEPSVCHFPPQIPAAMTAAELTCEVLDLRNITVKDKEYWTCWEVSDKLDMGETEGRADQLLHGHHSVLVLSLSLWSGTLGRSRGSQVPTDIL